MTKLYLYNDGNPVPAPTTVRVEGVTYANPTQATLRLAHYDAKPWARGMKAPPSPREGWSWTFAGWQDVGPVIVPRWRLARDPAPPPKTYDKYLLVDALMSEGVWGQVEAWLKETPDAWTRALMAPDISGDEPLLAQGIAAVKELLGWTDEQVAAVLAKAEMGGAA